VDVSEVGRMMGTDASVPVAAKYPPHPITEKFRLVTAYPLARSVTAISGGTNGHAAQNIIETSAASWGETDLVDLFKSGKVENDKTKDLQGPGDAGRGDVGNRWRAGASANSRQGRQGRAAKA
jgi:hypothetical protein